MLDITVCIMSYNRSEYLQEAVSSVLSQTMQAKKVVIYDNGSDSNVFEGIKQSLECGVEWVGADINHPFVWNFNRAMKECSTKYIVLIHDDDRLCAGFLEVQVKLLNENASLVAISCNGYLISEAGNRTGGTLVPFTENKLVEMLTCSGQVAKKYASNSCIPFSPTIYRRETVRQLKFREEFGKVCDAVYYCDLAEIGTIAYQTMPLYECRVHSGQDSSYFPYNLMNQLEAFYWSRNCVDDVERKKLHILLLKQHASRNLKQFFQVIKNGELSLAASLLMDSKFRFVDALIVISRWCAKKIWK